MPWGSPIEIERRRRILLSIWAYAYEFENDSLVSDVRFDKEARLVDVSVSTGNPKLDAFFREHFQPDTGMWVQNHPELNKLTRIYIRYYKNQPRSPRYWN